MSDVIVLRPIVILITALAFSAAMAVGSQPSAEADFDSYPYSVSSCPASYSKQIDPITVV